RTQAKPDQRSAPLELSSQGVNETSLTVLRFLVIRVFFLEKGFSLFLLPSSFFLLFSSSCHLSRGVLFGWLMYGKMCAS
ncbi:hypothetical protein, partial [Parvibaculum sedimenti]|uniref:hypothetical protein n=1 Tax=Parvibaculum sedimenti TaxID=2608632 RepID=UPI00195F150B